MNKKRSIGLYFIFLLLMVGFKGKAQFQLNSKSQSVAIEFKLIKNLIVIPLKINNKGPFNFILDSGIGVFLISDHSLVDTLKFTGLRKIKMLGFGEGKELEASVTRNLYVTINDEIAGVLPAAVLDEDSFDLSSYTGIPIHGFLGYEFFNSFTVKINYLTKILKVYKPDKLYHLSKASYVPITIESNKPYLEASIGFKKDSMEVARLIIDTGAGHPLWLESIKGAPVSIPHPSIRANLGVGLNGSIKGYMSRLPAFDIGKYRLENITSAFPDFEDVGSKVFNERNGNLGNSILKRFIVVFDYKRNLIQLKPNYEFKKPFEHDLSGLELVYHPPDYKRLFVGSVEEGSAAEDAGLIAEDEIVSINLKPSKDWETDEIYQLLRSKPDRSIVLSILPKGEKKIQTIVLTLKRRI